MHNPWLIIWQPVNVGRVRTTWVVRWSYTRLVLASGVKQEFHIPVFQEWTGSGFPEAVVVSYAIHSTVQSKFYMWKYLKANCFSILVGYMYHPLSHHVPKCFTDHTDRKKTTKPQLCITQACVTSPFIALPPLGWNMAAPSKCHYLSVRQEMNSGSDWNRGRSLRRQPVIT